MAESEERREARSADSRHKLLDRFLVGFRKIGELDSHTDTRVVVADSASDVNAPLVRQREIKREVGADREWI